MLTKGKEWDRFLLYEEIANEYATYVFDSAMLYYKNAIKSCIFYSPF